MLKKAFKGPDGERQRWTRSDRNDRRLWVESLQVVRVARHNGVMTFSGQNYDGSVDDVGCTRGAAELPARAREVFVKRHNFDFCSPQKPSQCDLCGAIAPSLPYNARWYPEISALSQSPIEQSDHTPVTAIQRDQRAGVQCHPRRRGGSARFAHFFSCCVGSPCSAIKSRTRSRRDSCRAFSARARAMYPDTESARPARIAR